LEDRASPYLLPSELLTFAACDGVPLHSRQIYTLATYLYLRGGELAALEWGDVNLERRYVLVHRAEHGHGDRQSTKTKRVRKVPIEHALLPALREMHDEVEGEGLVVEMPPTCEWAASLHRHLRLAGVTRADLFADDETRRQLSFHDLRHTGITWRAVRGDSAFDIKDGACHTDLETTQRYVNEAQKFGDDFGEVFPPLPTAQAAGLSADRWSTANYSVPRGIRTRPDRPLQTSLIVAKTPGSRPPKAAAKPPRFWRRRTNRKGPRTSLQVPVMMTL
jgi:hypothetical protein